MKDEREMAMSPEERAFRHTLSTAMLCRWTDDETRIGARKLVFVNGDFRIHDYHALMIAGDDRGFVLGAEVFRAVMAEQRVEPVVQSHLLTRLARSLYDYLGSGFEPIRESQVSWFGRFVKNLIVGNEAMFLAWAESMNVEDPYNGFEPQPTAVIRGALFAPALNQAECAPFWELAAQSETFPMRVFSDPCSSREGCIFSGYHRRVLTAILSAVSDDAARKIAAHIREQAVHRSIGSYEDGAWTERLALASDRDRKAVFDIIAQSIDNLARRDAVSQELHKVQKTEPAGGVSSEPVESGEPQAAQEAVEA